MKMPTTAIETLIKGLLYTRQVQSIIYSVLIKFV